MSDPADTQRLIGDAIRYGTIASVDRTHSTCTVTTGDILSPDICWLAFRAGGTAAWSPPTIGEQCLILCPEGDLAAGVVLVGIYSDANPAPSDAEGVDLIRYADGAEIAYDAIAHRLTAKLPAGGAVEIEAPGGVSIAGPLTVTGPVSIDGKVIVTDDVIADGKSLKSHRHVGVQTGTGQSGGPA